MEFVGLALLSGCLCCLINLLSTFVWCEPGWFGVVWLLLNCGGFCIRFGYVLGFGWVLGVAVGGLSFIFGFLWFPWWPCLWLALFVLLYCFGCAWLGLFVFVLGGFGFGGFWLFVFWLWVMVLVLWFGVLLDCLFAWLLWIG